MGDDLYDWSDFSAPGAALDLLGHATRRAAAPEGTQGPFYKARALTGYRELSPAEVRYYGIGNTGDGGTYYGFNARIIATDGGSHGFDAFLEDVCDPAYTESPKYTWRIIGLHTMYIAADQELAATVTRGDIVLVRKEDLTLKHGEFVALYSIEEPPAAPGGECHILKNLNYAAGTQLADGKQLYNPDNPRPGLTRRHQKCTHQSTGDFSSLFDSIKPVKPGKQLGKFGKNNYRLDQPTLGNMKWFADKKVTKFYRLNNDGGAKMGPGGKIKSGDLSHSYDPQTGLCVGSDLEGQFAKYLGAKLIVLDAGNEESVKDSYVKVAKTSGNTMIHCTHGADRTGYAVALALQGIGGSLPGGFGNANNPEDLYKYTVSFNSWDPGAVGTGGSICGKCKNMGFAVYLNHFYKLKDFCAQKNRINTCCACKTAARDFKNKGRFAKWGVTGGGNTPPPPDPAKDQQTEKQKCEADGKAWWPTGWVISGCDPDTSRTPCSGDPGCHAS